MGKWRPLGTTGPGRSSLAGHWSSRLVTAGQEHKRHPQAEKSEFDGLLVNTTTAIAAEAKHAAVPKHIELVLAKAALLLRLALEGSDGPLRGVTGVVPALAGQLFVSCILWGLVRW